ncbi:hypothetical protein T07_9922 [Trichinella nelsoni]|uniref:Uncharacterized protein n=1 Tax=Trichinella nelsoni TaxID=6336 RepID=A0A0V0RE86_9BILA|nr:hypothetical protein T07_9922 [Trichinella nelsoni]
MSTGSVKVSISVKVSTGYVKPQALPSGYARGQIKICICPKGYPQAIYSTIFGLRMFLCKFLIASGPRRRLRLCPRANKNLHIPAGYAQSILLHNFCLPGDMQIFICFLAMPRAFPQVHFSTHLQSTYLYAITLSTLMLRTSTLRYQISTALNEE